MRYDFLDNSIEKDYIVLQDSDKINPFLLKNHSAEILKGIDFLNSDSKFLYVHGFLGTGKRQYINYLCEFLNKNVIKLEYYCKQATVCDDILLHFIDVVNNNSISKAVNINQKITTLKVRFMQQISSIRKPFVIILHSFDDILEENAELIRTLISELLEQDNIKLILSTRAMKPSVMSNLTEDDKIFLKALKKDIFSEFLQASNIHMTDSLRDDFYKYTRGYYYYTALSVKLLQGMQIELFEFLQKFNQSGMSFDKYLGTMYLSLVPSSIQNFFWFLRAVRHGISINALSALDLYDKFAIEYLQSNLMIFQVNNLIYVQDYFLQNIDISIPYKVELKLHKYIIGIYETQLKASLKERIINFSRQALRAEIEYHSNKIIEIEEKIKNESVTTLHHNTTDTTSNNETEQELSVSQKTEMALKLAKNKKYTEAVETFQEILEVENIDLQTLVLIRLNLANLYKTLGEYQTSSYYYELVEKYYKQHKEIINLNYLYYDMTDLYFKMYKHNRAIETIKKVIYSVDTPQSLMVSACTLLGNIYADMNNTQESYSYYKKAIDSLDENIDSHVLADLYFKFALANDERDKYEQALEYYNKCIAIPGNNPYKALAYSNLASCYLDNDNYDDAKTCFKQAYDIEKSRNNYDGIYYNAFNIAKILLQEDSSQALDFLIEAKNSAKFVNEDFYILESAIALGDYYYNQPDKWKESLCEYLEAQNIAEKKLHDIDTTKITKRIQDMQLRMNPQDFEEIERKYARYN